MVLDNKMVKLSHKNQELYIVRVKFEHAGTYRCVVTNGLTEAHMEGMVTVIGECIILNCCHSSRKICESK